MVGPEEVGNKRRCMIALAWIGLRLVEQVGGLDYLTSLFYELCAMTRPAEVVWMKSTMLGYSCDNLTVQRSDVGSQK